VAMDLGQIDLAIEEGSLQRSRFAGLHRKTEGRPAALRILSVSHQTVSTGMSAIS
jgi:hypothetical protein